MKNNENKPSKAMILLSGGQDSTTCLYWALHEFNSVEAIGFNYGQRHAVELELATKIANVAHVSYTIFDIDTLASVSKNSLVNSELTINEPEGDQPPNTLVEGRNLLFLTYAGIYAKQNQISDLIIGVSQTDYSGYPDCRHEFICSAENTISLALNYSFRIHAPLMWKSKMETWKMANDLGVLDIIESKTLTCYHGIPGAGCGECPACKLRSNGLKEYKSNSVN